MKLSGRRIYSKLLIICIPTLYLYTVLAEAEDITPADSVYHHIQADSAKSYTDKGLNYFYSGDFESAERYLQKSLDIYQKIYPERHQKIGITYMRLGAVSIENWKYKEAIDFLDKAEENFNLDPEKYAKDIGSTLINKGIVFSRLGDLKKARMVQEMALKILLNFNDPISRRMTINLYNSLAVISEKSYDYQEAIRYYLMAEHFALKYNKSFMQVVYGNLGVLYERINNFAKSEDYYKKAINYFPSQNFNQPFKLAQIYSNYAELCLKNRMFEKTFQINRYAEGLVLKNLGEKNPVASDIYKLFGRYYEAITNYDSALYYYQKSICSLFDDFDDLSVYANPDISSTISKVHLLGCLKDKAGAFRKYFQFTRHKRDLQASLESYDLAVKLIDEIRMGYQDEESKLFLNENERITYDEAISVAYLMYNVTGNIRYANMAFEYSEKSKASVLLAALRNAGAKGFGSIPDSLLKKENDLMRDIAFNSEQLYEETRRNDPDSLKIDRLERKLFRIRELYDDLISIFEHNYPEYYTLKYQTGIITMDEIQDRIQKGTTVLEYSLTDSVLYTFLIRNDHYEFFSQPLDSLFQRTYDRMLTAIGQFDPTRHNAEKFNQFVTSATRLYNYLIKPQVEDVRGQKLIIIPDGILAFIPFEALLSDVAKPSGGHLDYNNLPLLLKEFAISYGHSSTMLFEQRITKSKKPSGGLLAFAPSYNGADKISSRGTARYSYRKDLASIPGAREEVENIIRLFKGKLFIDKDATEIKFKEYSGDYDMLHLAMHAVIDNQNPMYSKLVFTATSDSTEDDLLNTHEIYNLDLKARMVVLSSCSSGEGTLQKGEGVISLARGFSYAGCPSLIMTLWEIEDKVSADLMVGFYRYLKKGYQKDIALQKAKIDFLSDHTQLLSHPFYWSAYQCIGDTSSLFNPVRKYAFLMVFAGFSIIIYALYRRYNRPGSKIHSS